MAYNVKFLKGTNAQYTALSKDLNTFYYVDDKDLYLGNIKLSNAEDLAAAIVRVAAIEADYLKNADKTALQTQINTINEELGALTGSDSGQSIGQMISNAIKELDDDLQPQITANANAIKAIQDDYLTEADKTELSGLITAEATTARAAEKANADAIAAVKEDVDAFFLDADLTASAKDTLKEIQEYINSDATAAAEMTASINGVKGRVDTIEADYLVEADKTELQGNINTLTTTVNGKASQSEVTEISGKVTALEGKVDVAKVSTAIATAKTEANSYTDGKIAGLSSVYEEIGVAETKASEALSSAKTYTNEEIAKLGDVYDTKGAANTALTDSKSYTDTEIGKLSGVYDAKGAAATAEQNAKDYADGLASNYDAAGSAATAEANAKAYADGLAGNYDAKGSAATAKSEAIAAASTDATTKANNAESNAKSYVDTALTWGTIA